MKSAVKQSQPRPDALLVLGMHRSGTSATAGALGMVGLTLGDRLIDPAPDNPKGYFEHKDAVTANETLLDALDRSWNDVRALPSDWLGSKSAQATESVILASVIDCFSPRAPWAIKDPRLCRLLPLWLRALSRRHVRAACLLVVRHPDEVAASLATRNFLPHTASYILWLRYVLESIRDSAGLPRALLRYDTLLDDPAAALSRAGGQIGFRWAGRHMELSEFVSNDDRHHRASMELARGSDNAWRSLAVEAYAALCGPSPWTNVLPMMNAFQDSAERHNEMIELLGSTLRGGDLASREWSARMVKVQTHADTLARGLETATALSFDRLAQLEALDLQLRQCEAAKAGIEETAHARLAELERMALQLADTQKALTAAERQSVQRLAQLEALDLQLRDSEAAKVVIEETARGRLAELERMALQLADTQEALLAVEQLSVARLAEIERQAAELVTTHATIQSLNLRQAENVHKMRDLQAGLDASAARNLALDAALAEERAALASAQREVAALRGTLASAEEAERQWQLRAEASAELAARLHNDNDLLTARLHTAETMLDAIRSSWSWRLAHPVQWYRQHRARIS